MGDQADNILSSLGLLHEDSRQYGAVKGKFEGYLNKKRNVIIEWVKFNMRSQEEADSYLIGHGTTRCCFDSKATN